MGPTYNTACIAVILCQVPGVGQCACMGVSVCVSVCVGGEEASRGCVTWREGNGTAAQGPHLAAGCAGRARTGAGTVGIPKTISTCICDREGVRRFPGCSSRLVSRMDGWMDEWMDEYTDG